MNNYKNLYPTDAESLFLSLLNEFDEDNHFYDFTRFERNIL